MAEVELPEPEELREKSKNTFSKRVALVTAIYAVMLAITSLGGNNATKEMMLSQQQASDQWAFYQAKALREHLYHSDQMLIEALGDKKSGPVAQAAKGMAEEEARFNAEK